MTSKNQHINSDQFREQTGVLLELLTISIAQQPQQIRRLLSRFGMATSTRAANPQEELMEKVLMGMETKGRPFHVALAELLYTQATSMAAQTEDTFDFGAILSGVTNGPQSTIGSGGGGGITVGADPVSAIAGAVGSIANLFGNKQRKKMLDMQTRSQTLQTMLAYKAQREANEAEQPRLAWLQQRQKMIIGLASVAVVGFLLVWLSRNNRPAPSLQPIRTYQ